VPPPSCGPSESVGDDDTEPHVEATPEDEGAWLGERLATPLNVPRGLPVAARPPVADTHAEAVGVAAQQRVGEPVGEWLTVALTVPHSEGEGVLDCDGDVEPDTEAEGEKEGLCVPDTDTLAQVVTERDVDAVVVTVAVTVADADTVCVGDAVCVAVPQGVAVVQPLAEGDTEVVGDPDSHALPVATGDTVTDSVHETDGELPPCDAVATAEPEGAADADAAALAVAHCVEDVESTRDSEGRLLVVPEAQYEGDAVADCDGRLAAVPQAVAVGVRDDVEEGEGGAPEGVPSAVAFTVGVTDCDAVPVATTVRVFAAEVDAVPVLPT
jgi:hypothetical protein